MRSLGWTLGSIEDSVSEIAGYCGAIYNQNLKFLNFLRPLTVRNPPPCNPNKNKTNTKTDMTTTIDDTINTVVTPMRSAPLPCLRAGPEPRIARERGSYDPAPQTDATIKGFVMLQHVGDSFRLANKGFVMLQHVGDSFLLPRTRGLEMADHPARAFSRASVVYASRMTPSPSLPLRVAVLRYTTMDMETDDLNTLSAPGSGGSSLQNAEVSTPSIRYEPIAPDAANYRPPTVSGGVDATTPLAAGYGFMEVP